ncbi:MAG: phosphate signaling complex protein PhoU [Methanocellales archaeon]|nr:phosphate signaling complex protein PhoU [Methanocellales archaeon]MDD3292406.1 phosphate signaling complex protein PhoU [Methanocellales archaeon]MDD5235982.1 phosphate signaling complex protein PhoU [Methanocellales archaeon]MDD5485289.1 phosphate signaling complex protein PhoU [Methanocellales archaeon]
MEVRKEYIEDLKKLKKDVQRMGELAKESAGNAIKALVQRDMELSSKIIKENNRIDKLEFDIEKNCIRLLALQQPMAVDLRTIETCMKIITDFDRISDLAGDIAEIVQRMANESFAKPLIDIPRMSEISQGMISDCLLAFSSGDIKMLGDISARDDLLDGLFDQIRRELLTIMIEDPKCISNASNLTFVALHLERIGDHACNIAGRVIYMVTGERIKLG